MSPAHSPSLFAGSPDTLAPAARERRGQVPQPRTDAAPHRRRGGRTHALQRPLRPPDAHRTERRRHVLDIRGRHPLGRIGLWPPTHHSPTHPYTIYPHYWLSSKVPMVHPHYPYINRGSIAANPRAPFIDGAATWLHAPAPVYLSMLSRCTHLYIDTNAICSCSTHHPLAFLRVSWV